MPGARRCRKIAIVVDVVEIKKKNMMYISHNHQTVFAKHFESLGEKKKINLDPENKKGHLFRHDIHIL